MKSNRAYLVVIVLLPFVGCASYQLEPLTAKHPAHPEGMAAPKQPVSKTLAYTSADVPSAQGAAVAATQEGGHDAHHPAAPSPQHTAVGEGKIVATVPNANQLVVEHGEIKGFMDAMTMGYGVDPPSLLEGLRPGDKVRFTIDVPKKAIVKIEKMK
jgi:Cu/Ag efflux protein CusF